MTPEVSLELSWFVAIHDLGNTPVIGRVPASRYKGRKDAVNSTPAVELTSGLHSAFHFTRALWGKRVDEESAVPVYQPSPVEFGPRSMPEALRREQINADTMRKYKYFHARPASRKNLNIAHRLK